MRSPVLAALVLVACALAPAAADEQRLTARDALEGVFLVNFIRFSQWPPGRFEDAHSPYLVTVVGSAESARAIATIANAAVEVQGRPIEVRRLRGTDLAAHRGALRRSHVVFLDSSADVQALDLVEAVEGAAVLTVGDTRDFTAAGGMLGLVSEGGQPGFVANVGAIRRSRVEVSAKMLKLARHAPP